MASYRLACTYTVIDSERGEVRKILGHKYRNLVNSLLRVLSSDKFHHEKNSMVFASYLLKSLRMSSTIASLENTRGAVRRMVKHFVEDAAVGDLQPTFATIVYCEDCYDLTGLCVLLSKYTHPPVPVTIEAKELVLRAEARVLFVDPGAGPSRNYQGVY